MQTDLAENLSPMVAAKVEPQRSNQLHPSSARTVPHRSNRRCFFENGQLDFEAAFVGAGHRWVHPAPPR